MKFIELFAGIGGFRYGLERVQFKNKDICEPTTAVRDKKGQCKQFNNKRTERLFNCVWANEINKYPCQIYRKNFGGKELHEGDITKVKANDIPDHDLITAGFPCQAFSAAGKRGGFNDTRGTLFFEIARICCAKKPKYILLENVKGLLSHGSGATFQRILKVLSDIGYILQWEVLNSKNFGVPQNRERVFIIGHLRGESRPKIFPIGETAQKNFETKIEMDKIENIRRPTLTECERLQGFPDDWTKEISDTQRYKCLGNAVTTNVIQAIGEKLRELKKRRV